TTKPASFYPKLERIIFTGVDNLTDYKQLSALANAVRYARDLINEPANYLTPEVFAADIRRLEYLGLEVKILDEKAMKERGFGLALAVAQGSVNKPRIAEIKWRGDKSVEDFAVGLVGKGVTFDSGGISIKPAAGMGEMKQDMAGAAAMVAVMKSLALQQVKKNVVAVVGLVENMPSGSAYRPGDIFRSMSGQTVEVLNTDAEGRLVLADCLTYIQEEFKPAYVIDMATLTGAIVIALGHSYAGLFSNNAQLAKRLTAAGEASGELLWQLPLNAEFNKLLDSDIADMKNIGGRAAGSCTAACFLQRFVKKETKWAHLDIAGMDLVETPKPLYPKGASAYGVRLINQFINEL
ncbi:MAG: leucyl aminopeptidase, partial [Pseudomonadota bacterium]|nr:leucyl aminopeptidase [Pseudomonadota bacterium]